jgi:hypothetical protein
LTHLWKIFTNWFVTAFTDGSVDLFLAFTARKSWAAVWIAFADAFLAAAVSTDVVDGVLFADSSVAPGSRDGKIFILATFAAGNDLLTFVVSATPGVTTAVSVSTEVKLTIWTGSWWIHAFWSSVTVNDTNPWFAGLWHAVTGPAFWSFTILGFVPRFTVNVIFNVTDDALFDLFTDWKSTTGIVGSTSLQVASIAFRRWAAIWITRAFLDGTAVVWSSGRSR